ncbi:hypothetical protein FO519_002183 [Halicephalobus sp. NKZ332]|nr:hypothetical protein FO519_002183 [Halicephalobus sp. NKZ332]
MAFISHLKTMLTNPGTVPKGTLDEHVKMLEYDKGEVFLKCTKCSCVRPERAHHCRICDSCIKRMDHHCPWMYISLVSFHSLYWTVWQFVLCVNDNWRGCSMFSPPATTIVIVFLLFEAILFAIFTCVMFGTQISSICSDQTGIESLKNEKGKSTDSWKNLQVVFGGPFSIKWFNPLVAPFISERAFEFSMLRRLALRGSQPPKVVIKIVNKAVLLSLLCYIGAFGYIFYATQPDVIENTRVSENAFLPGVVRPRFDKISSLSIFAKGLRNSFKNKMEKKYVVESLKDLGLEVYNQSYKFSSPYNLKGIKEGENIYGILRTTKNPSVESMLIVVPLDESRLEGASLILTMADYFKDQVYWARDIIFLFTDPSPISVEAWLSAFHGYSIDNLFADPLPRRSGTITGVYIFDFAGTNFDYLDIKFFGVNGRQPNLDLVNVANTIASNYRIPTKVNNIPQKEAEHNTLIESFVKSIYKQTFSEVEGLHSVFGSYGISAVSIVGVPSKTSNAKIDLKTLAIFVELCFRSLNNILEKLHQSYFLYYLLSPNKFMSVAFYMPISGLTKVITFVFHPLCFLYLGQFALAYLKFEGYGRLLNSPTPFALAGRWSMEALIQSVHKHLVHSSIIFPLYSIFLIPLFGHLMSLARFKQELLPEPVFVTEEEEKEKTE